MSPQKKFNKVFKPNRPTFEYYADSWSYFTESIDILRLRGATFITMADAYSGNYNPDEINIILDHHIDFYPVETEVMCRWELENGLVSSVYLFNHSPYIDSGQSFEWGLEDLNVEFYQHIEAHGFEIGYHSNAVGRARLESNESNRQYTTNISDEIIQHASEIFERDVEDLRRHFNLRTYIPHGAGEGNHQLKDVPASCKDLIWAYNGHRRFGGVEGPRWRNFSDSNTFYPQRMNGSGATYITRVDNLQVFCWLAEPGLNHILLHAGRYSKGMPYELYKGPTAVSEDIEEQQTYFIPEEIALPVNAADFASLWMTEQVSSGKSAPEKDIKSYVYVDDEEALARYLLNNEKVIATLFSHRKISSEEKTEYSVPRGVQTAPFPLPSFEIPFLESFRQFFNLAFSPSVLSHLMRIDTPIDAVELLHLRSDRPGEIKYLANLLDKIGPDSVVKVKIAVKHNRMSEWKKVAHEYISPFRDAYISYDSSYQFTRSARIQLNIVGL